MELTPSWSVAVMGPTTPSKLKPKDSCRTKCPIKTCAGWFSADDNHRFCYSHRLQYDGCGYTSSPPDKKSAMCAVCRSWSEAQWTKFFQRKRDRDTNRSRISAAKATDILVPKLSSAVPHTTTSAPIMISIAKPVLKPSKTKTKKTKAPMMPAALCNPPRGLRLVRGLPRLTNELGLSVRTIMVMGALVVRLSPRWLIKIRLLM